MEALSAGWWLSLLAIVLIDLVLTGERAVVIAEAARQLPRRAYGGALAAGTVLALLMRVLLTKFSLRPEELLQRLADAGSGDPLQAWMLHDANTDPRA